jgi:hypothetical protein
MIMSFDNGPDDGTDVCCIKARVRAAMDAAGLKSKWNKLCELAGVDPGDAHRAVERSESDFASSRPILEKLAQVFGRDASWLMTGSNAEVPANRREDSWERILKLSWEYIYKANISVRKGEEFVEWLTRKFNRIGGTTQSIAFRRAMPQNLRSVAREFEAFKSEPSSN